jgi:uncharacterized protein (DUF849 family)
MAEACIIELRANESARRIDRPNVPLSPDEIVSDAKAAARAGASILHWHARDALTGRTSIDPALNSQVCRGVRAATDLLLHPTLGADRWQDPVERTAHVVALADDPLLRADLVPVDFGSVNIDLWDEAGLRFRSEDRVYLNPRQNLRQMLEIFQQTGLAVVSVCWNVGHIRTARAYQAAGLLGWTLWQLVFTGDVLPDGMAATRRGLEAMVEQVPDGQPWSVLCVGGDALELAGWAIELGGHVSIGLGDWSYDQLGSPHNADIVGHVAAMVERAGRAVATPAQTRQLLQLPTRPA